MKQFCLFLATLISAGGHLGAAVADQTSPNVILMMADDLATEDVSCYGGTRINTPRLDALAKQGVRLTSYYAGSSVCTPSRMALLSGSYPARLGWRWGVLGYGLEPQTGMSPAVYTIAECFRDAGYRTALAGKWHVGNRTMSPEHQGFESASYISLSNNQNRDLLRDGHLVRRNWDNRKLTETFTEEVIRVIREKSEKPFFLYVPWTAPHFPAESHPDWLRKHEDEFVSVVEELDFRVGQILDALDSKGIADDTIVIFTSDNGRQAGSQVDPRFTPPYTGMKWQSWEGGTRVPCIVRWPGKIGSDTVDDGIMSAIDWFPTLAAMCHVPIEIPDDGQTMDGIDCTAMLTDENAGPKRTELLYWHGKGQATAIRSGDWKLFFNAGEKDPNVADGAVLFNLATDVMERTDVARENPEKVRELLARAKTLLAEIYADQTPLGTWEGVEIPAPPLRAEDVWGTLVGE